MYRCIKAECRELKAEMIAIGGTSDHVHVLMRIPTVVSVAQLVKQVKGSSSHLVNKVMGGAEFKWQGGYGAFTVSKALVPSVRAYVVNQAAHHQDGTTDRDSEVAWVEAPAPVPGD